MSDNHYDVLIVGGGVSGGALLYELAAYTNAKRVLLVEKYGALATLNSSGRSNSQTIHCGDIETNYTLEKAAKVKRTAKMVEKYCLQYHYENQIIWAHQKMVMGVGDDEVAVVLKRHADFKTLCPYLEVYDKKKLKAIEPSVVLDAQGRDRPENIAAIGARGQYTTVDFGALTRSFAENAQKMAGDRTNVLFNAKVETIRKSGSGYEVVTSRGTFSAAYVVVNAGAHSLFLAHRMGYGTEYGCLPMVGSFYLSTRKILNGKVYMVQRAKLPFAALHGDPDMLADGMTRFGPTTLMTPKLERYTGGTHLDFIRTLRLDRKVLKVFWDLMSDYEIRHFMFRNFLFELPMLNKRLFVHDARKIIPSLQASDVRYATGFGGLRPQLIHKTEGRLILGEASIDTGEGLVFNMTPSPGATSCLGNAERDVRLIAKRLDLKFDEARFNADLVDR